MIDDEEDDDGKSLISQFPITWTNKCQFFKQTKKNNIKPKQTNKQQTKIKIM